MNFNATLIGQSISFIIFVMFIMKFVWPILLKQMKDRETRIADGLAAAEQGHKDLADAKQKSSQEIEKGKEQAAIIISKAQKRGDDIILEAKGTAKAEAVRIRENALDEIEQDKEKARQALKKQVASLVVVATEQILMREVDAKAHDDLLVKITQQL